MEKDKLYSETFRIGEWVVGGVINVNILNELLTIKFLEFDTNDLILVEEIRIDSSDAYFKTREFLEEHGTPYYSDRILSWIESIVTLNKGKCFNI